MAYRPLISIIVPTYNYGSYIAQTLKNLVEQHYQEIEIIVIDDGSTDDTREIVASYLAIDHRVRYFYQNNAGLSAARNLGLQESKGAYIQFLDSDDLISPDKLSLQVGHFEQQLDLSISFTKAYYFETANPTALYPNLNLSNEEWMPKSGGKGLAIISQLIYQNIMPVNAALVKREVFNLVRFDTTLKSLEDWDVWLDFAFQNLAFGFLEDDLAYALIRVHQTSMSQNRHRMLDYEMNLRSKIETRIEDSLMLSTNEKKQLDKKNNKRIKTLLSLLIKQNGMFNLLKIRLLLQRASPWLLFKAYLKTINDYRRSS